MDADELRLWFAINDLFILILISIILTLVGRFWKFRKYE